MGRVGFRTIVEALYSEHPLAQRPHVLEFVGLQTSNNSRGATRPHFVEALTQNRTHAGKKEAWLYDRGIILQLKTSATTLWSAP